jgi:hypothetical protein
MGFMGFSRKKSMGFSDISVIRLLNFSASMQRLEKPIQPITCADFAQLVK